ncbi:bacillithiol biosynthesis deacetylase BshB1 [Shimazuella alba]|uniref:Bacillithiol biosynthesis deacetylase BshB1 n=1 Tax=Shimazuella alba TaxID=2690964 RepID=A0A6I4VX33_9BACL|nr:bacillithiol biosynthesis deacetylase BshB1 [Shimazuella alba]MXQ52572.1 bacillithiol biosynthesis deacetylase BshB1 [Shimazuella alba]
MSKIDILAFGAHPDDVELGAGGILAKHARAGFKTAICDLTYAELSSNGTVENRQIEAERAGEALGLTSRYCLGFPDRGLIGTKEQLLMITQIIRQLKPKIIFSPYFKDRHPDHVACNQLVKEAVFDAGIQKIITPGNEEIHRVSKVFHYFINDLADADVIVDIGSVYQQKIAAFKAYKSQFGQQENNAITPLNKPNFFGMIEGRDRLWGQQIGVTYGEALVSARPISLGYLL